MGDRRGSNPLDMTDDDSISITSTAASAQRDNYFVEGVIAEREDDDGEMKYLVRWEGYPDERCTWEPASNFENEATLLDWQTQKMRVSRGFAQPCDVEALLSRVEEWIASTRKRKQRRRAKRLRLGYPVSPTETDTDEADSDEEADQSSMDETVSPVRVTASRSKGANLSDSRNIIDPKGKQASSSRPVAPVAQLARVWTEEEEQALLEGLARVNGPYFDQILGYYGPAGTVSQILKERNVEDLQEKSRKLREKFQEQGTDLPSYLYDISGAQHNHPNPTQVPGKAPTAVMFLPQKRDRVSGDSKSTSASSNASPTKISFGMGGKAPQQDSVSGVTKKPSGGAKSSPTRSKVGIDRRASFSEHAFPETEQTSKLSSASSSKHASPLLRRASLADSAPFRKRPNDPSLSNPVSPVSEKLRKESLPEPGSKPTITTSKVLGRPRKNSIVEASTGTRQIQRGRKGAGPARLSKSDRKPSKTTTKNVPVSGATILSNWNKKLKGRKSKAFQPGRKDAFQSGTRDKPAQKFSIVRRYAKAGRNEPAPNIENLTFVNLKDGGIANKTSHAVPQPKPPPKTPFQLIQESLEADAAIPMEIDIPDPLTTERNLDDNSGERNLESKSDERNLDDITGVRHLQNKSGGRNLDNNSEERIVENKNDNSERAPPNLRIKPITRSEVPGSESRRNDTTLESPLEIPTEFERTPMKRPLSELQNLQTSSTQPLSSPRSMENPAQSEIERRSDAQAVPRGPRNEWGRFSAGSSSKALASPQDRFAFPAQGTFFSRPNIRTTLYGVTTQAQKDRATSLQRDVMDSGVEDDILGNILIGPDCKDSGDVRFRGLDKFGKQLLLSIKVAPRQMFIRCRHICTVGEYQEFYRGEPNDYLRGGYVVPFWQSFGPVGDMAEILKSQASGAICYAENFSALFYPTDSGLDHWDFLNKLVPQVPEGAALRFVLRKPLPPPDLAEMDLIGMERQLSLPDGESNIDTVFRNLLGIEYERLIKQPTPEKTAESNTFFLFYVGVEKELSLMCRFLSAHGATIYSWDDEGTWDYFCHNVEVGVILIEGSFYELYLIPNLSRLLRKPINVFNITFKADELAPHPHINRLFPHGQAILVTDSFLLLHPQEASRFLRWFRLQVQANKPVGTWKLCVRPGIRDLLLTIIEERSEEDGFPFMQMYESLYYIIPEDSVDDEELEDDIDLDTDLEERTIRCMSSSVSKFDQSVGKNMDLNEDKIARNDATLVEWFAGWAMTQVEYIRRFHIIAGAKTGRREMEKTEWERKWSHIEVLSPQTAFEKYKIANWERDFEKEKEKTKGKPKGKTSEEQSPEKISPTG